MEEEREKRGEARREGQGRSESVRGRRRGALSSRSRGEMIQMVAQGHRPRERRSLVKREKKRVVDVKNFSTWCA